MAEQLIKSKERKSKYGEVYTPAWVVKRMCDLLYTENPDDPFRIDSTFLEPACGNGNFLVEILQRKLDHCKTAADLATALHSIYAIDIMQDNTREARQRMKDLCLWWLNEHYGLLAPPIDLDSILYEQIICGESLSIQRALADGAEWGFGRTD